MSAFARISLLGLVLGLSACAVQQAPQRTALPPLQTVPSGPITRPAPAGTPMTPSPLKPAPRTSASFAPPPGGASHWDQRLGVYVLDAVPEMYYRQRTYYHWNNGWTSSISLDGPWQATDTSGVPPGLGRLHP